MTEFEALEKRISVRSYDKKPVPAETVAELRALIGESNSAAALHFQLVDTISEKRPAVKLSKTMFSGEVGLCALLVGPEGDLGGEMTGYYGEKLVLRAVSLGLGSCWVAGTYDRKSVEPEINEGEKLWAVVPMGFPAEKTPVLQRTIRSSIRAKSRKT